MASKESILAEAHARAQSNGLPYQGLLLPTEANQLLREHPDAVIVDVRSKAEWDFVGRIPGAVEIEWKSYPGMIPNPQFAEQLAARVKKDALVMFICRSGGRSNDTATIATKAGFKSCFNVLEGFEGDRDGAGHRNSVGGWRAAGLPWSQS